MTAIDPLDAKARLHEGTEIAFLDLREAGQFGEGHPLFAVPCPYSRLEQSVVRLVPRRTVPLLLLDAGDGVAERAAEPLARLGYSDVSIVAGGAPGWSDAGLTLFKGVNVPSKTLGELAEPDWHPKTIDAARARALLTDGAADLFDARPAGEYRKMHVPGATCVPNGELAHRMAALDREPGRALIVGCAGRTRGIVGAIGMRLAGIDGPIYALENGTQGWALAGYDLTRGEAADDLPALDAAGLDDSRQRAEALIAHEAIDRVEAPDLARWLANERRTTFLFDVRSPQEAGADPVPGAVHALGGQLVQASDQYVGVRHARIVLADDTGLRAAIAAFWLRKLGYETAVCSLSDAREALVEAPERLLSVANDGASGRHVTAEAALSRLHDEAVALVDLRSSRAYRDDHVAGAHWSTRAALPALAERLATRHFLLIADDAKLADNALGDLLESGFEANLIEGGHDALRDDGAPTISTPERPSDAEAIDYLLFVHDRHDGNLEASRAYLAWEKGLVAQLDPAERAEFS